MTAHHLASYLATTDGDDEQGLAPMHEHDSTKSAAPQYLIRVKGHLEARWATWFDGMTLAIESDGTTTIHGPVVDQAALHGLLQKLRDVGIPLISLTQVEPHMKEIP
jgi:hypothetical protein